MNLSIIIPIYQIERELEDCLSSIYNQLKHYDVEVLMINDGSQDCCESIALKYTELDPRFHYFYKPNGGLSDARNYGLSKAVKDYIWFVDGDDRIAADALKKVDALRQKDWDVLYFDYCEFEGRTSTFSIHESEGWKDGHDYLLSPPNAWNKIVRRSLLEASHFQFPKGLWYEDRAATGRYVNDTNKIYYTKEILYEYRVRQHSLMNQTAYNPHMLDIIPAIERMIQGVDAKRYHDECEYNAVGNLLYQSAFRLLPFGKTAELNQCVDTCLKYYPDCEQNKYVKNRSRLYRLTIHLIVKKRYGLVKLIQKIYQRGGAR